MKTAAACALTVLLAACDGGTVVHLDPDPDPVFVACTYSYQLLTSVDEGDYGEFEFPCAQYDGDTTLGQLEQACEDDGTEAGATSATCTCLPEIPENCEAADSGV